MLYFVSTLVKDTYNEKSRYKLYFFQSLSPEGPPILVRGYNIFIFHRYMKIVEALPTYGVHYYAVKVSVLHARLS